MAKAAPSARNFAEGSVALHIVRMSLPMMAAQLVNILYNVVDRIYISNIPGTGSLALAGVGVAMPVISLVTAFTGLEAQSLVVGYESSSPLPALSAKIKVSGRWPGNRSADNVSISPDWLSNDPLCVSIDAGQATGMALGSTTLTAAFAGKTFSLPVSVEHESLVRNDLILPAGLQAIAAESFFAVSAKAAVVPDGVQSIGDQAFASCANLYQIYIPSSVRSISESAFSGCPALTYICCPEGSTAAAYARAHGYTVLRSQ